MRPSHRGGILCLFRQGDRQVTPLDCFAVSTLPEAHPGVGELELGALAATGRRWQRLERLGQHAKRCRVLAVALSQLGAFAQEPGPISLRLCQVLSSDVGLVPLLGLTGLAQRVTEEL